MTSPPSSSDPSSTVLSDSGLPDLAEQGNAPRLWKVGAGAGISTAIAYFALQLLQAVMNKLPSIPEDASRFARSVSLLVRYMLVGGVSLMTFMFAAVALGLLVYAVQILWQRLSPS